ncbi:transcription factor GTE9-like isoform X2 [Phalaenopsis equestris]|nr:transcription factor GTE9-like isoform X2 [Phalaenopsis equestris]
MGKTHKSSREYTSGFVPGDRHAVEAVGESEGFTSHGHARSEDSCVRKRRCISLNDDKSVGFFVPIQVISFSEMSRFERKNLEVRFRRELEQVQKFQKKILSRTTLKPNGVIVSSSGDPLMKLDCAGQNITQLKCGIGGRVESMKQVQSPPSITVLMKQCETLLKRLMAHQYAWVFNTPVDAVKLNIPDYFTVIKQPMDLGTVKSKIVSGAYSSPQDFASDVRLTFSNAMTYNPPTNDVHAMANVMRNFFESRWKPIEKKLAAVDMAIQRKTKAVKSASESLKRKIPSVDHVTVVLDSEPKMTDEEKLHLSRRLSSIPELPQHIVDFLKSYTDDADQDSNGEIEIDFDSLNIEALLQLKKLLDDYVQGNSLDQLKKTETCEMEILIESGLSSSSLHPCKGNGPADVVEYLDICGNEPPIASFPLADRVDKRLPRSSCGSGSSSSSSKSGSSSSDSDSCSTLRSESNMRADRTTNPKKENDLLQGPPLRHEEGPLTGVDQAEENAHRKAVPVASNVSQEGENAPSERQVSPDKLYRAALLRSRFADTIFKAREKTLDKGEKRDPEKLKQEREELERQQREERARLQAEAKAAEDARLKAEAEAAAEAKRRLELEREAARQALLQMEKTVEINENSLFFKDLEMLRTAPMAHIPGSAIDINPDSSNGDIDCFKFGGSNPLEQLGLFIKDDFDDVDDEGEPDRPIRAPLNDFEEGEID